MEGIRRFDELVATFVDDPGDVVVGIETDPGLSVHTPAAADYQVYAINPLAVARYRDRHNVAGAKSGTGDAKVPGASCTPTATIIGPSPGTALTLS